MAPTIVKVSGRADLEKFIHFTEKLYKNIPNWVPPLFGDEYDTFNPKTNGAYEYCECDCFLAYHGDEIVGRVAAIINHRANELWKSETVRFGWLDFIEDEDVARALIERVAEWGRERKCSTVEGPLGFTDMDKEGLLVEGYEHLSPFTCLYNFPYYDTILKKIGLEKRVDWVQKLVHISDEMPPMFKYAELIEKKYDIHPYYPKNTRELRDKFGLDIFHMYNETFSQLYQFTPITDKQIRRYLQTYVPILIPEFVSIIVNGDEKPIGFAFCVPSLSRAVKKARGRLFPFGFIHILKALKKNDTLEDLMIGVLPEYQGKGANVLMFKYLHENCLKMGIKRMILNPQLEDNLKVQSLFEQYETEPFMRRRGYVKKL